MFDKLYQWILERGLSVYLPLIVRKVLGAVGVFLAARGYAQLGEALNDPAVVAEIVAGILSSGLSAYLSVKDKFGKEQIPLEPKVIKP